MTPRDVRNIHTKQEHGPKTTPVFLPGNGEASWSLLPSLFSLLLGSTVQPEAPK